MKLFLLSALICGSLFAFDIPKMGISDDDLARMDDDMEQFAAMKKDNDILVRLIVKKTPCKVFYSAMRNQRTDFPVLACAVAHMNGEYRASIGARPARAMLLRSEKAEDFAAFVAENAPTEGNIRGSAAYRTHLIKELVTRAMTNLRGM